MERRAFALIFACAGLFAAWSAPVTPVAADGLDLEPAIGKLCRVMGGTQKLDGQAIQLLGMMDGSFADMNPVSMGLFQGVIRECPAAYRNYHTRRVVGRNPIPIGSLYTPTTLGASPAKPAPTKFYPLLCRGGATGMGTLEELNIIVRFSDPGHAATRGLKAGQCSWLDRPLRSSEPHQIYTNYSDPDSAKIIQKMLGKNQLLTFYVYNEGGDFGLWDVKKGAPTPAP